VKPRKVENHAHAMLKITTWRERDFQIGVAGLINLINFVVTIQFKFAKV